MLPFSSEFQCRLLGPLYNKLLTTSDKLMKIMVSRPQKLGIDTIAIHSQHDGVCNKKGSPLQKPYGLGSTTLNDELSQVKS